uniref:Uncharacterized protein n=1 Tax=Oryza rufipogon TaxID=4529 RepID=A0A0E0QWS0_ORYRU
MARLRPCHLPRSVTPASSLSIYVCPLVGDVGYGSEGSEEEHAAHLRRIWTPLCGDLSPQAAAFGSAPQQT